MPCNVGTRSFEAGFCVRATDSRRKRPTDSREKRPTDWTWSWPTDWKSVSPFRYRGPTHRRHWPRIPAYGFSLTQANRLLAHWLLDNGQDSSPTPSPAQKSPVRGPPGGGRERMPHSRPPAPSRSSYWRRWRVLRTRGSSPGQPRALASQYTHGWQEVWPLWVEPRGPSELYAHPAVGPYSRAGQPRNEPGQPAQDTGHVVADSQPDVGTKHASRGQDADLRAAHGEGRAGEAGVSGEDTDVRHRRPKVMLQVTPPIQRYARSRWCGRRWLPLRICVGCISVSWKC